MSKPLTNRRILRALEAVRDSLPVWDAEALDWCHRNRCVVTVDHNGMPADVLTVAASTLLTFTEAYFAQLLKENREQGIIGRPEDNGKKEDQHDNTDQQARRGATRKGKQEKEVQYVLCRRTDCGQRDFPGCATQGDNGGAAASKGL